MRDVFAPDPSPERKRLETVNARTRAEVLGEIELELSDRRTAAHVRREILLERARLHDAVDDLRIATRDAWRAAALGAGLIVVGRLLTARTRRRRPDG